MEEDFIASREIYDEAMARRNTNRQEAARLKEKAEQQRKRLNPLQRVGAAINSIKAQTLETSANYAQQTVEDIRGFVESLDLKKTQGFLNLCVTNALSMGDTELSEELENMRDRSVEQIIAEYKPGAHSEIAKRLENIALFAGSKRPKAHVILIPRRFYEAGDIEDTPERLRKYFNLLGFHDLINQIPDFSKWKSAPPLFDPYERMDVWMPDYGLKLKFYLNHPVSMSLPMDETSDTQAYVTIKLEHAIEGGVDFLPDAQTEAAMGGVLSPKLAPEAL